MNLHISVLKNEVINALNIKKNGIYIDATFGRGGHSLEILKKLNKDGKLIAIDRDIDAITYAKNTSPFNVDNRFSIFHTEFNNIINIMQKYADNNNIKDNITDNIKVDGILLDLGVSSPQLDNAERGFSFNKNSPLDMRMNNTSGETVAEFIKRTDISELTEIFRNFGEEKYAYKVAKNIIKQREIKAIETTFELAEIIRQSIPSFQKGKDKATRCFQALRIYINQELFQLESVLPQTINLLKTGGRLVIISFHSLEDRIVKNFLKNESNPTEKFNKIFNNKYTKQIPINLLQQNENIQNMQINNATIKLISKAVKPTENVILNNPRARSSILIIAEKL